VLADGSQIPNEGGALLKERIDHFLRENRVQRARAAAVDSHKDIPPHIATGLLCLSGPEIEIELELTPSAYLQTSTGSDPEIEDPDIVIMNELHAKLQAAQAKVAKKQGKSVRFEGVELPPARAKPGPSSRAVANVPEEIVSPQVRASSDKGKGPAISPVASTSSAPSIAKPGTSSDKRATASSPQFKYQFPLEDPAASTRILESIRKSQIIVPLEDILSAAPDVRKQFRDQTTTRRVPVGTVSVHELAGRDPHEIWGNYEDSLHRSDNGTITGRHSVPLRYIKATVAGKHVITCVLDQGAEIIAMRKDIWESIGIPIRSDHLMTMESANRSKDATLGVLENLSFDFGSGEMLLQVQVVEKANYEILLGRPFFAHTSCKTDDFINGDQHLTISDPNSGKEIKIVTQPWVKVCPRCRQGLHCTVHCTVAEEDF
jgi:hypothetical protein